MNKKNLLVTMFSITMILLNTPVFAWQAGEVRISPFVGYGMGGDFDDEYYLHDYPYWGNVELDDGSLWGIRLGVGIADGVGFEWQLSHMPSAFYYGNPDGFFSGRDRKISDVDLYTMQGSLIFDLADGPLVPYLGIGLGATQFEMDYGTDETRFSGSLAGGIEMELSPYVSLRTEFRGYGIVIDSDNCDYCDDYYDEGSDILGVWETSVGLSFKL